MNKLKWFEDVRSPSYDSRTGRFRRRRKPRQPPSRVTISSFHNTGRGHVEGDDDPNYTRTYSNPGGISLPRPMVVISNESWTTNDSESSWVGFTSSFGVHLIETHFDLTGFNVSSASLTFEIQVAGSDEIEGIYFNTDVLSGNGVNLLTSDITGNGIWHPLTITEGFQNGINTLTFNLRNIDSGLTGIRIRVISATAEVI